ncbi:hypothetical protein AB1K56_14330 [Microbacterium sp. BWR-S6Y]|uniref:hypothetical protein n=1 Tax=Microbacterium sp. BWR-S6Y TaxID=3232073 RepID=UPI0035270C7B
MSPVLAAALARAEAAAGDLAGVPADTGATPPRRASKAPGRFSGMSGFFGQSTQVGGARRGDGQRGEVQRGGARRKEGRGR